MRALRLPRWAWLSGIVALGAALRLAGISFGLPYHHHWDEVWITESVGGMLRRHDSVPASYQYGEPLMWLTELVFVILRGVPRGADDITLLDAQSTVFLAGRLATAIVASTGTVAVYLAASRSRPDGIAAHRSGLAAALLYAVSAQLVVHARYAVTDACLAALTAWTLALAAIYLEKGTVAWGAACAATAGLTCAFKVPGIVTSVIPLFAALSIWMRGSGRGSSRRAHGVLFLATLPVVALVYVLLNPHVVDHHAEAMGDLVGRYRQTRDGGFSSVYLRTPGLPHLASALAGIVTRFPSRSAATSLAVSAVTAWGIYSGIRRRSVVTAIGAAYAVTLILSVALPNRTFLFRNYLVVVPALCLGFGGGVEELDAVLRGRWRVARWGIALVAAAALVGLPVHDAIEGQELRDDARVRAVAWIAARSRPEEVTSVATTASVFGKLAMGGYGGLRGILERPGVRLVEPELDSCPGAESGPDYVVDASYRDKQKAPPSEPWQEQWLFRECPGYEEVAAFGGSPYETDLVAYPTWNGRVSAVVLRRNLASGERLPSFTSRPP